MNTKQKKVLVRIIVTAVLLVGFSLLTRYVSVNRWIQFGMYLIPYLIIGYDILKKAGKGILNRQVFDENFLMALATVGAIALGDYKEGVAVMLFYQIGEWFQSYAVGRSRRNISELMDIRPDYANIEKDGQLEKVDPDEVEPGSIIVVQPGEKVPIDGVVIEGNSTLNTSALTGESVPREVAAGEEIISGCINLSGVLKIRTSREFGESTVSKILELMENASSRKSRSENFISKFARYYTPAVCFGALALAVLPPVVRMFFMSAAPQWGEWIYRALTFLVISCPCALVISIPLSFFAGIGGASAEGILIKGSNYMETLAQTKAVVFDKTGTITQGVFEVCGIHEESCTGKSGSAEAEHAGYSESERRILEYAALAECHSTHPISVSLQKAYGKRLDMERVTNVQEISGHGIIAEVDGHQVCAGNDKLMKQQNIDYRDCSGTGTVVHVAIDGKYEGHILISDVIKEQASEAMRQLKETGVRRLVMLTGDDAKVAAKVAGEVGITEYHSGLLPADKVTYVEEILGQKKEKEAVAFVGDGINDAPVLSRADIGIAMGALGSDAAIEAADIVLMDDDPSKISKAIRIARKCMRIVYENIYFAIGVKGVCLFLGAVGIANMWVAIFADVGVMVLAVLNAVRTLFTKKL
ncbi:MAG: heavy metal translocating P-type ATPase [Lachnospiraceae bacterium]|nr:heavy metal translocating P-type ATPase [Lachnospiraceae bacterium]